MDGTLAQLLNYIYDIERQRATLLEENAQQKVKIATLEARAGGPAE